MEIVKQCDWSNLFFNARLKTLWGVSTGEPLTLKLKAFLYTHTCTLAEHFLTMYDDYRQRCFKCVDTRFKCVEIFSVLTVFLILELNIFAHSVLLILSVNFYFCFFLRYSLWPGSAISEAWYNSFQYKGIFRSSLAVNWVCKNEI